jgi:hypothetical protein
VFAALLQKYDRDFAQAFLAAIADLRSAADLSRVIEAISRGDIEEAIAAMHLDPAAFAQLQASIATAYSEAGHSAVAGLPALKAASGARFVIRFDVGDPRAAAWLREHGASLVTRIVNDQREAIRNALADGIGVGQNPRTTALDIVGRINRTTGRRDGGVIGLSSQQEDFVIAARKELASGESGQLRHYLTRARRDKRFDATVLKAIREETQVPQDIAAKAVGRYKDRLLQLRGAAIARTESLQVLHAGQDEAFQQEIDRGAVKANQVRDTWRSAADSRVRDTHRILDGETIRHGDFFTSPSGARMRFPGDTALGAGPEEIINCRCWLQKRIDFLSNLH